MSEEDDDKEHSSSSEEESTSVTPADGQSFESSRYSLSPQLIANLNRRGLTKPTKVQYQVIPKIQNERGGDILVNAPTGSGKTLAYALPITQVLFALDFANRRHCQSACLQLWDVWS
jgi:superfamily II DNA/RNA helicase